MTAFENGPIAVIGTHDSTAPVDRPSGAPNMSREMAEMLLYEELARARIRDLHESVHGKRPWVRARSRGRRLSLRGRRPQRTR